MIEDDAPSRPPQRLTILPLDGLGVAELEAYLAELRSEITRADAALVTRRSQRGAADLLFRPPPKDPP